MTTPAAAQSDAALPVAARAVPLTEQVVLVTGASRGAGAAMARAFGREGAMVVVNYLSRGGDAEVVACEIGDRAIALKADVRDFNQVQDMVSAAAAHFGAPVTTVVSNALVSYRFDPAARATAGSITWGHYLAQLEGAVQAGLNLIQATRAGMQQASGGRFIAISSNLVHHPVVPYHDYTTAKAALVGFVRNMAAELGPEGITANLVSGGLLDRTDASSATSDAVFDIIRQSTPLREVVTPEAFADAVLFFASPWARAVTGQDLVVDGGLVMR